MAITIPYHRWGYLRVSRPNLSVFDHQSRLPINLQRDGVAGDDFEFDSALLKAVLYDYFAYAIVTAPTTNKFDPEDLADLYRLTLGYPGLAAGDHGARELGWTSLYALTNRGYVFVYGDILRKSPIRELILVPNRGGGSLPNVGKLPDGVGILPMFGDVTLSNISRWFRIMLMADSGEMYGPLSGLALQTAFCVTPEKLFDELRKPKKIKKEYWSATSVTKFGRGHYSISIGDASKINKSYGLEMLSGARLKEVDFMCEYILSETKWNKSSQRLNDFPFEQLWLEAFPDGVMPFNGKSRGILTKKVKSLGKYVDGQKQFAIDRKKEGIYESGGWRVKNLIDASTL